MSSKMRPDRISVLEWDDFKIGDLVECYPLYNKDRTPVYGVLIDKLEKKDPEESLLVFMWFGEDEPYKTDNYWKHTRDVVLVKKEDP